MAQRVGADLWHMSTLSGPDVNFKAPEMPIAFGYGIQNPDKSPFFSGVTSRSVIMVGSDGTRFVNEAVFPRHGHINNHGTWVSMQIPTPGVHDLRRGGTSRRPAVSLVEQGQL